MSAKESKEIRSAVISDKDKSIKSKQCNKFSIENILGLNDDVKLTEVNRLELMGFDQKGKVDPCEPFD
jgi:hypothetical protein